MKKNTSKKFFIKEMSSELVKKLPFYRIMKEIAAICTDSKVKNTGK